MHVPLVVQILAEAVLLLRLCLFGSPGGPVVFCADDDGWLFSERHLATIEMLTV